MSFFSYIQNNSGGDFVEDATRGISHYVIVEADNAASANMRARGIGLYFDGAGDCECCGHRWYAQQEGCAWEDWEDKGKGYVHYLDGRTVPVNY